MYIIVLCLFYCLFGMFTILDYSSALEYGIIRRYTNSVYYYMVAQSHKHTFRHHNHLFVSLGSNVTPFFANENISGGHIGFI